MAERKTTKAPSRTLPGKLSAKRRNTVAPNEIAQRAYERFLARGAVHGHDLEDWLAAEQELRGN